MAEAASALCDHLDDQQQRVDGAGRHERQPSPSPTGSPELSAVTPEPHVLRDIPCEGCIRAAIAGKGQGRCYEVTKGRSRRCRSCKVGNHTCRPCHSVLVPIAKRMLLALDVDSKMYDRCRKALRLQLDLLAESNSVYEGFESSDAGAGVATRGSSAAAERKRASVKAAVENLVEAILL
ncbi:uncharacterized protein MAM_07671 [Metarhizium album ARSEF 1941]|uniref:Uncharacterized protein n=1 Tax=Metarhizium album (strain ARSEF 1941) TaxID=1081103 RepID=A0A0B2WKL9_METAS|nr:uncharacterized protein MAM_07671 [Metarhizium album ARSEF 1941]KHN94483.1 hypothetical protein MAM_07671 [Metarhizium album ARSEF 1941]